MEPLAARDRLERLVFAGHDALITAFAEDWFNELIPDARLMIGCDQGAAKHVEGDVAVHTVLVFNNLLLVAAARLRREPNFVERLSVLLHDVRKPAVREERGGGEVGFPNHEALAAKEVPAFARRIGLTSEEERLLTFLVARHGDAHSWLSLASSEKRALSTSPDRLSLALLQEADARSCIFPDGSHLPVFWSELCGEVEDGRS